MNKARVIKQVAGFAVVAAAMSSLNAGAGTYSETVVRSKAVRTETVSFADLDLTSAQGQESLYQRLRNAARGVCGSTDPRITGSLGLAADNRECFERALNDALSQVNAGQVASSD
jgi:UrcA family protein